MEHRNPIRSWRERRAARQRTEDPYAESLRTASHLGMLRRDMTGEDTEARWWR